ncbi:MAG: hypothetical protein OXU79_02850 [Gemmatimonadota bacterium]|nr:hypothetical protein [Gemmatimonadota bacterium]
MILLKPFWVRLAFLVLASVTVAACGKTPPTVDDDLYEAYPGLPYGIIITLAGTGDPGRSATGTGPLDTDLYFPQDMAVGPDGRTYILDWNNNRVVVIDNGTVRPLIGNGEPGEALAGPALEVGVDHPAHISFDPRGRLILSAWQNSRILRYDAATRRVQPIAGRGDRGFRGDGGPALEAWLNLPSSTAFDSSGRMYISDQGNLRVRMVDLNGTISTVAGTGREGFAGDGGPAALADLYAPTGDAAQPGGRIALDSRGNLYIADTFNNRIRMVDTGGRISTVAGGGSIGATAGTYSGDGGPAIQASLSRPSDVAVDAEGNLYIADTGNHCIRKVDTEGVITTLAGRCGEPGFKGDSDHPRWGKLRSPYGVALDSEENLYIADTFNHRIRVVYKHIAER